MILKTNIYLFKFLKPNDVKISKVFLESIILNISFIQKHGVDNNIKNININNRVYMDQLDCEVDLEKLIIELNDYDASYEPEQFPGMSFKDAYGLTYLLFGSGKITITGVKSLDNLEEHVNEFKELITMKLFNK